MSDMKIIGVGQPIAPKRLLSAAEIRKAIREDYRKGRKIPYLCKKYKTTGDIILSIIDEPGEHGFKIGDVVLCNEGSKTECTGVVTKISGLTHSVVVTMDKESNPELYVDSLGKILVSIKQLQKRS